MSAVDVDEDAPLLTREVVCGQFRLTVAVHPYREETGPEYFTLCLSDDRSDTDLIEFISEGAPIRSCSELEEKIVSLEKIARRLRSGMHRAIDHVYRLQEKRKLQELAADMKRSRAVSRKKKAS